MNNIKLSHVIFNKQELHHIGEETAKKKNVPQDEIEEIVDNAAAAVLRRASPQYLNGNLKLSEALIKQIKSKALDLVTERREQRRNSEYNKGLFQHILSNLQNHTGINREELVAAAIVSVLDDPEQYRNGKKRVNDSDLNKIQKEVNARYDKAKKELKIMARLKSAAQVTIEELERLRARKIMETQDPEAFRRKVLKDFYLIMGLHVAYAQWKQGDILPGPYTEMTDYQVHEVITPSSWIADCRTHTFTCSRRQWQRDTPAYFLLQRDLYDSQYVR